MNRPMNRSVNRYRPRVMVAALAGLTVLAAFALPAARAHEGHEHDEVPKAASSADGPRFALATDLFEVIGALEGRRLTVWIDRSADNLPVAGASIDLQVDGHAVPLERRGDVYVGELAAVVPAGRWPVAVTVLAGSDADVLAGEWVVEPGGAAAATGGVRPAGADGVSDGPVLAVEAQWVRAAAIAAVAALLAGVLGWRLGRRAGRNLPGVVR